MRGDGIGSFLTHSFPPPLQERPILELSSRVRGYHIVKPGESLETIAGIYQMPIEVIRKLNRDKWPLGSPNIVKVNMKLVIFEPNDQDRRGKPPPPEHRYNNMKAQSY